MRLIGLQAENFMRLRAVEIAFTDRVTVIAGQNAQGKSAVLKAIEAGFGGAKYAPDEPVRRGAKAADIVLKTDEIIVRRHWTAGGSMKLTVEGVNGSSNPQKILDSLAGPMNFDPVDFTRKSAKDQADLLRKVLGLDFAALDAERTQAFADRTTVNRDLKAREAQFAALRVPPPGTPDVPEDVSAIKAELDEAAEKDRARQQAVFASESARSDAVRVERNAAADIGNTENAVRDAEHRVADLERQLAEAKKAVEWAKNHAAQVAADAKKRIADANTAAEAALEAAEAMVPVDIQAISERMMKAGQVNAAVELKQQRARSEREIRDLQKQSERYTRAIDDIDQRKRDAIAAVKMPVPGLSFTDDGLLLLNNVPFSQASSAEQLAVSVALAVALQPKLRLILIRDGSLLDDDAMKRLGDMAESMNFYVLIERVGKGDAGGIVIEDGEVIETA